MINKISVMLFISLIAIKEFQAQTLKVDYQVDVNTNDAILSRSSIYTLILSNGKSAYFNNLDSLKVYKNQEFVEEVKKVGEVNYVKLNDEYYDFVTQDYFYKDYKDNELIFNELIFSKKIVVKENLDLFSWDILPKDTLILNQKCKTAKADFRGRTYTAYYASELFSYGAPWKFDGLPGIMLSIKSDDGYFSLNAVKIEKTNAENTKIVNPYINDKLMSWEEFKLKTREHLEKQLKKLKSLSQNGEGGSIEITDKIEDLGIKKLSF